MNFKNMTYKDITQLVSSLNTTVDIDEAIHQLNDLTESLKVLRNMLEGRRTLQMQKDKLKRRGSLKVVTKGKKL